MSHYDQIDGVAMGSPLAPVLANLFTGYHEKQWLLEYKGTPPVYYRIYVMVKRRRNNVVTTSVTSIQRCFNVV